MSGISITVIVLQGREDRKTSEIKLGLVYLIYIHTQVRSELWGRGGDYEEEGGGGGGERKGKVIKERKNDEEVRGEGG